MNRNCRIVSFVFGFLCATSLCCAGAEIKCDNGMENPLNNGWKTSKLKGENIFEKAPGRSGKCNHFTAPDGDIYFYWSKYIPVDPASEKLVMSVYARGEGAFLPYIYCHLGNKKLVSTVTFPEYTKKINSSDWKKIEWDIPLSKIKDTDVKLLRIVFKINKNADIFLDDFSGRREKTLQNKESK